MTSKYFVSLELNKWTCWVGHFGLAESIKL